MAWQIDSTHARIQFSARHMMISDVCGHFEAFTGSFEFDEVDPSRSSVVMRVEASSLNTNNFLRDAHLTSPDFLNAKQYPYLYFKSTRIEHINATHGRMIGDLTIRDRTREVVFDVKYAGQAISPWGKISAGFSAMAKINRRDWGLVWNQLLGTSGALVGNIVTIRIDLEIIKQNDQDMAGTGTTPSVEPSTENMVRRNY